MRILHVEHTESKTAYDPEDSGFTELMQLRSGGNFNEEIVGAKVKPGSSQAHKRYKCLTDTHFAILSKTDFVKCLAKFEAKAITKMLYFLQDLPFFKSWSKTQLNKILTCFKVVKYQRGHVLFKEG